MPQRRLSQRQIQRIEKIQERRRQRLDERAELALSGLDEDQPQTGMIVVRHGANLAVEDSGGKVHHCLTRRNIGHPVCGDRVVWQATGKDQGVVTAVMERRTVLSRPDYSGRDKPLAANLTHLVVLVAPRPEPSEYLVDQYLAAAELMGVEAMIACNKVDLLDARGLAGLRARFARYELIGYPVVWISLHDRQDHSALTRRLHGQTSILVGQSGVGKSSLVKALLPDREIQIGRLSKATGRGRHTTSATTCYRLRDGGYLIDSPGVRSFRLASMGLADLERGFRELTPYLGKCRFGDCRHDREPGCALRQAVAANVIHPERLANFLHLAGKLDGTRARQ